MRSRSQALLENYDDIITGMMQQMDAYAERSGGYMNRTHPDEEEEQQLTLSEERRLRLRRMQRSRRR